MTTKGRQPKAIVRVRAALDERARLMLPPQIGEVVMLWRTPTDRLPTKTHGVPKYLDGKDATVIGILGDGTFRVQIDYPTIRPNESETRIIRLDEMSQNLGNPKDWPREDE